MGFHRRGQSDHRHPAVANQWRKGCRARVLNSSFPIFDNVNHGSKVAECQRRWVEALLGIDSVVVGYHGLKWYRSRLEGCGFMKFQFCVYHLRHYRCQNEQTVSTSRAMDIEKIIWTYHGCHHGWRSHETINSFIAASRVRGLLMCVSPFEVLLVL